MPKNYRLLRTDQTKSHFLELTNRCPMINKNLKNLNVITKKSLKEISKLKKWKIGNLKIIIQPLLRFEPVSKTQEKYKSTDGNCKVLKIYGFSRLK